MSLKLRLAQLLAACGILSVAPAPRPTPPKAPRPDAPIFPIPNWNGTIPKGSTLYRYNYNHDGHKGFIEVLALNSINAESKARKRLMAYYGPPQRCEVDLVGAARG